MSILYNPKLSCFFDGNLLTFSGNPDARRRIRGYLSFNKHVFFDKNELIFLERFDFLLAKSDFYV